MLKIVPDPPPYDIELELELPLEHLLDEIAEHLACAAAVARQALPYHLKPPGRIMGLATLHEIDIAHIKVQTALSRISARH